MGTPLRPPHVSVRASPERTGGRCITETAGALLQKRRRRHHARSQFRADARHWWPRGGVARQDLGPRQSGLVIVHDHDRRRHGARDDLACVVAQHKHDAACRGGGGGMQSLRRHVSADTHPTHTWPAPSRILEASLLVVVAAVARNARRQDHLAVGQVDDRGAPEHEDAVSIVEAARACATGHGVVGNAARLPVTGSFYRPVGCRRAGRWYDLRRRRRRAVPAALLPFLLEVRFSPPTPCRFEPGVRSPAPPKSDVSPLSWHGMPAPIARFRTSRRTQLAHMSTGTSGADAHTTEASSESAVASGSCIISDPEGRGGAGWGGGASPPFLAVSVAVRAGAWSALGGMHGAGHVPSLWRSACAARERSRARRR